MAENESINNMLKATLFIDSLTRSAFIPFGPVVVYHILKQNNVNEVEVEWTDAVIMWGKVCASYVFGRLIGHSCWGYLAQYAGTKPSVLLTLVSAFAVLNLSLGLAQNCSIILIIRFLSGALGLGMCNFARYQHEESSGSHTRQLPIPSSVMLLLGFFLGPLIGGVFWDDAAAAPQFFTSFVIQAPAALSCLLISAVVISMVMVKAFFSYLDRDNEGTPNESVELLSSIEEALESGLNVQEDSGISQRYIRVCKGNMVKAQRMWQATLDWRREQRVDEVLQEPQPHFYTIKRCYPHVFHGRTRKGELVCYEKPGCLNIKGLIEADVGPKELGRHYMFINEILYSRMELGDEKQIMTVLDVGEFNLSIVNTAAAGYLKATAEIMQNHYPERVARMCIVNAPYLFAGVWKSVASMLAAATVEKISFSSSATMMDTLQKYLDLDQIPQEYGGTGGALGSAIEEKYVVDVVAQLNQQPVTKGEAIEEGVPFDPPSPYTRSISHEQAAEFQSQGTLPIPSSKIIERKRSLSFPGVASGCQSVQIKTLGKSDSPKLGLSQRLRNLVGRPFRRVPVAHLGQENMFVYDEVTKQWVVKAEPCSGLNVANSNLTLGTDEHGVILAIQAAHMHAEASKTSAQDSEQGVLLEGSSQPMRKRRTDYSGEVLKGAYSSGIIFVVGLTYGFWCGLQMAMEAVFPAFLLTSTQQGGLQFAVPTVGITVACGAASVLLLLVIVLPHKLVQMPLRAPLRAIRLGTFLQTFVMICLPHVSKFSTDGTPNDALAVWTLISLAVTGVFIATATARSGASMLLALALKTVSKVPRQHATTIAYIGEIIGPLLGTSIFAWALNQKKRYPLDSTFCFNLCAVLTFGMYLMALVIHLNVIDDFGSTEEINTHQNATASKCEVLDTLVGIPCSDVSNLILDTKGRRSHYRLKDQ